MLFDALLRPGHVSSGLGDLDSLGANPTSIWGGADTPLNQIYLQGPSLTKDTLIMSSGCKSLLSSGKPKGIRHGTLLESKPSSYRYGFSLNTSWVKAIDFLQSRRRQRLGLSIGLAVKNLLAFPGCLTWNLDCQPLSPHLLSLHSSSLTTHEHHEWGPATFPESIC